MVIAVGSRKQVVKLLVSEQPLDVRLGPCGLTGTSKDCLQKSSLEAVGLEYSRGDGWLALLPNFLHQVLPCLRYIFRTNIQ